MALLTYSVDDNDSYTDWEYVDAAGTDYSSYFISGPKVHGQGITLFQSNYLTIYSRTVTGSDGLVDYMWDYNEDTANKRFSRQESLYLAKAGTSSSVRRLWLRGQGYALQIRVQSVAAAPFHVIGWSAFETANSTP